MSPILTQRMVYVDDVDNFNIEDASFAMDVYADALFADLSIDETSFGDGMII